MCTEKTRCPLGDAIRSVKKEFYSQDRNATEEDILGVMIAVHFGWDGLAILQTAAVALEDANFHDECEQVMRMLKRLKQPNRSAIDSAKQTEHKRLLITVDPQILKALTHAYQRLNEIRHKYADTDFKLLREAIAKAEGKA